MATLYLVNVPHNCTAKELTDWVESSGVVVKSVRLIQDKVTGVSPAFAYVDIEEADISDAVIRLNGRKIRERVIKVCQARRTTSAA